MMFQLSGTFVQNDDDDDDEDEESDDEVAAVRAQQKAAHFGWFDDLFVFSTGKLYFCILCVLIFQELQIVTNSALVAIILLLQKAEKIHDIQLGLQ